MLGSVDARRSKLSAVVRIRGPALSLKEHTTKPPNVHVRRDGPRHVTVEVPECRTTPRQTESFEVTEVLPLNATPKEIFAGVGSPVVDWLWDGFNAVVLSYGQARSGKTTLLVGKGAPLSKASEDSSLPSERPLQGKGGADGIGEGEGGIGEGDGGGAGLIGDILSGIFGNAAAATSADGANPTTRQDKRPSLTPEAPHDILNPLAGSWSPSRHAHDESGLSVRPGSADPELSSQQAHAAGMVALPVNKSGVESENSRKGDAEPAAAATTLLEQIYGDGSQKRNENDSGQPGSSPPSIDGVSGTVVALSAWEVAGKHVTDLFLAPPSSNDSTDGNRSGRHRSVEQTGENAKGSRGRRSRSRNGSNKNNATGVESSRGDGGGPNGSGRRRNSRGCSGSDDSSSAKGGWPTGYPEGFLTVRAPSLTAALKLVDVAQHRCVAGRGQRAAATSEAGAGSRSNGGGGGKTGGATSAATATAAVNSHVFFRVVVYNTVEETVSTLHLVDLDGGWEPPSEKPAGRRGSKGSGAGCVWPSAMSREWNNFDTMITGLVPPPPAPPPPATGSPVDVGYCGHVDDGVAADGSATASAFHTLAASKPLPLPPHPVFGSPKGKSFGGGGGGKLVETLRPLMSGNTRTWMVVSVSGGGGGGAGAAWRALDVARRATGICTTCIRLRGVALADLRLRSSREILSGDESLPCSDHEDDIHAAVIGRPDLSCSSASSTPAKSNTMASSRLLISETSPGEKGRLSSSAGQNQPDSTGQLLHRVASPGPSLLGLVSGESSMPSASTALGGVGTSYVDNFLAGFVRGDNDDGLLQRISSGGSVQSDVVLKSEQKSSTAPWPILDAADAAQRIGDVGRGEGNGMPTWHTNPKAVATSVVGKKLLDPHFGEQQQQHKPHTSMLLGSLLRPGGRLSTVVPTLSSSLGRSGAATFVNDNGDGSAGELKNDDDDDDPTAKREIKHRSAARSRITGGIAERGASRARGNIDRMVSSLLQEVLPDRRPQAGAAGAAVVSPNSDSGGGYFDPTPSVRGRDRSAAFTNDHASARQSPSSPPPVARCLGNSTPVREGTASSTNSGATFLTPIEVLMNTPARGRTESCEPTMENWVGGCRQYNASTEAPTNGAGSSHSQRATKKGDHPLGCGPREQRETAGARSPRMTDEQTPMSTSQARDMLGGFSGDRTGGCRQRASSPATGHLLFTPSQNASGRSINRKSSSSNEDYSSSSSIGGSRGRRGRSLSAEEAQHAGASDHSTAERAVRECREPEAGSAGAAKDCTEASKESDVQTDSGEALRRSHAALLRVIREQEDRRKQMERRFEAKECDWLERVTALEADLEGLRAEAVETRGRLRRAEASSPSAQVFERYEAHAGLLEAENTSLRDQNLSLELRLLDVLRQSTTAIAPNRTTATVTIANADLSHHGRPQNRHSQPATLISKRAEDTRDKEEETEGSDFLPEQRLYDTDRLRPEVAATRASRFGGGIVTATGGIRVDGNVPPFGTGNEARQSPLGGGTPVCAAALKTLRRRLKEVEQEAMEMRAERAAMDKRDRLCQAQLRTLTEQRSMVRELSLREREHKAMLTSSSLESARAEVVANLKAVEIEQYRDSQASLIEEREALVIELAEERRKSRQFDEDRRAYGHIRRFIERHSGGRPAEWDRDDLMTAQNEGKVFDPRRTVNGFESSKRERQHCTRHIPQGVGVGETTRGSAREQRNGGEESESESSNFDLRRRARTSNETVRPQEGQQQKSTSFPRRISNMVDVVPSNCVRLTDDSGCLYSNVDRDNLSARLGVMRHDGDGARLQEDGNNTCRNANSHSTLKFAASKERTGMGDTVTQNNSRTSDPQKTKSGRNADGGYYSHWRTAVPDGDLETGGSGEDSIDNDENTRYHERSFAATTATAAWGPWEPSSARASPSLREQAGVSSDLDLQPESKIASRSMRSAWVQ